MTGKAGFWLSNIIATCVVSFACAQILFAQTPTTFRIATWNVRSGMGEPGMQANPPFVFNTNCSDPTMPQNASGAGLFQPFIVSDVKNDPKVVAFGTQESWSCGDRAHIAALLPGWVFSPENPSGVMLYARFGIVGQWVSLKYSDVPENTEARTMVGANVCVVADCSRTVWMYTTHVGVKTSDQHPTMIQRIIDEMNTHADPKVVFGDFNMWSRNQWSPADVKCSTLPDQVEQTNLELAVWKALGAGYIDAWASTHTDAGQTGMVARNGCGAPLPNGSLFKRIDYFFSKGLTVTWSDRWAMPSAPGAWGGSDHVGLKAEYVVPGSTIVVPNNPPPNPPPVSGNTVNPEIVVYPFRTAVFGGSPSDAWSVVADATAAGGMRLQNKSAGNAKVGAPLGTPVSFAEFKFTADANVDYHIWFRMKSPSNGYDNDSFFAQFSDSIDSAGQPIYRIGTTSAINVNLEDDANAGMSGWGWQDNGYGAGILGANVRFGSGGIHTIRLQPRDDGVQIDQMVLSQSRYISTAPGTLKNDATILPEQP